MSVVITRNKFAYDDEMETVVYKNAESFYVDERDNLWLTDIDGNDMAVVRPDRYLEARYKRAKVKTKS